MDQEPTKDPRRGRLRGRYTNYFEVGHNAFEFIIDCGEQYAETSTEQFHTRLVTTPGYAQVLLETLQGSIDRYERTFGPIPKHEE